MESYEKLRAQKDQMIEREEARQWLGWTPATEFEVVPKQDRVLVALAPDFAKTLGVALQNICEKGSLLGIFLQERHLAKGTEIVALNNLAKILANGKE